jgi:hypothetical protein
VLDLASPVQMICRYERQHPGKSKEYIKYNNLPVCAVVFEQPLGSELDPRNEWKATAFDFITGQNA